MHAKFALHAVHQDFQVQFAHARDDGLLGLLVESHHEGRILVGQSDAGLHHFLVVGRGSAGVMLMDMTGAGNSMDSRMIGCSRAQSVSPVRVFCRPTTATMSPQRASSHGFLPVRVHPEDAADALLVVLRAC